MAGAYAATAVNAARTEEYATRGAIVLAGPVSRVRWLGSQVGVAAVAAAVIMLVTGLLMGLTATASLGERSVAQLVGATAVTLPAVGIILGVAVVVMGVAPRAFGLVWAYVTYVGVVGPVRRAAARRLRRPVAVHVHTAAARRGHGLAARARARRRGCRPERGGARRVPAT